MTTAVATRQNTVTAVQSMLMKYKDAIAAALPRHMTPERMIRVAITTIKRTPGLMKCDPMSLCAAIVESSQLGLEIDGRGLAYLVPYGTTATLIPGYKGLMDLAYRSGRVESISAEIVYKGDKFEFSMGTEPRLHHVPNLAARGDGPEKEAVYAVAKLKNAGYIFSVLAPSDVEKIKKSSAAAKGKSSPWHTHEEEMWKKTAIRRLCKYLPLSPEMARAVVIDEAADAGLPQNLAVDIFDIPDTKELTENETEKLKEHLVDESYIGPCPDNKLAPEACEKCKSREGCPAWGKEA